MIINHLFEALCHTLDTCTVTDKIFSRWFSQSHRLGLWENNHNIKYAMDTFQ